MKLNHVNISVENVMEARIFFETYFNFVCIDNKGDNALVVLKGTDGFILVLMSDAFNRERNVSFPSAFHIGFLVNTKEEVLLHYNKLKSGNIQVEREPANMRGVFGFYFHAPGNILVEISSGL